MPTRPAIPADAASIKQHIYDFLGIRWSVAKIRRRMADPNIITYISEDGYCELKVSRERQEAQVTSLLPQGTDMALLDPVLQGALVEMRRRHPPSWRVWATFWGGVDENGVPDGGESECWAWQSRRPGTTVSQIDGRWVAESTLGQMTDGA